MSAFSFSSGGHKRPEALLTKDSHHDEVVLCESQKQLSYGTPQGLVTSARVIGHKLSLEGTEMSVRAIQESDCEHRLNMSQTRDELEKNRR